MTVSSLVNSIMMKRFLQDEGTKDDVPATWELIVTIIVLVIMFAVLITDRVGTDSVMLTALTVFYISGIIDVKEALSGFNSQGLLTVLVLFVVAEGLNKTGALNWYVGKLFGRPTTLAGAQLRVMIPIMLLSGFINDTPLVTVVLPIVIQWARKVNLSPRFILMPLSFAALLGGVFTIIGTSTNLIVVGLLMDRYPDDPQFQNMSLFGLGQYGVPVGFTGVAYIVLMTPLLLARRKHSTVLPDTDAEDVLLGARVTEWSPAAGRTIKRSGLRDTGGIYLVRVKRQATGNVHHAVSPEFIIQVGDILYFTGLIESFGEFCDEHGLEVITNEVEAITSGGVAVATNVEGDMSTKPFLEPPKSPSSKASMTGPSDATVGTTLDSILEVSPEQCMRIIYSIEDAVRGTSSSYHSNAMLQVDRIVVTKQKGVLVLAVDSSDRPGLLLDISKCLARLNLNLLHTEAAAIEGRSLSIWRGQSTDDSEAFLIEVWTALHSLIAKDVGASAIKQRGLQVIRASVRDGRLVGKNASQVKFRELYKAAIVAIRKADGKTYTETLSKITLEKGDQLVLQVSDNSPLLELPPEHFYSTKTISSSSNRSSFTNLFGLSKKGSGNNHNESDEHDAEMERVENAAGIKEKEAAWNDLQVLKADNSADSLRREFMTAMKVGEGSGLVGKTAVQAGIDKLPGVFLLSLERPTVVPDSAPPVESFSTVPLSSSLQEGDVLWFSGTANAVGDLRKIPGLVLYESDEVAKMEESVQNRRLVEAVVARRGPLVGKTVKEVHFRTQYGAAVIAVHRSGNRVHELPGKIKLQAGDVMLLEAGQSFLDKTTRMDGAFALIAEVDNSSPPRFRMLFPALVLTIGAYACYVAELSSLWGTAMVASILMVILGVLSEEEARAAIRWEIYLTIAPAFGIGQALINSGVAGAVANFLVRIGKAIGMGNAGLLGSVYLATVLLSQVVANNAAAALIFPIAMDAAEQVRMDLTLMSFAIMLAASAAFMTPFGYQTNLMVMGPGGYTTLDYLIIGTPMQIVLLFATTIFLVTPQWYICWLGSLAFLVAVSVFRIWQDKMTMRKHNSS